MITFNALLRSAGVEPSAVKLVRHQDKRRPGRPTPYSLWRAGDPGYELYQRIQRRPVYRGVSVIASFVATPRGETLFTGLYKLGGCGTVPVGTSDPVSGEGVSGQLLYDLTLMPELGDCRGRLVVEWGEGFRAWVQLAQRQDKPVAEFRRNIEDPPFPGPLAFRQRLSELAALPPSWRQVLSSVAGVYLLVCPRTGKQYVGSAFGAAGFWGRWMEYVETGHGGNQRLRELPSSDYQVAVLEVAASSVQVEELMAMESRWKEKLGTREFGLNAN